MAKTVSSAVGESSFEQIDIFTPFSTSGTSYFYRIPRLAVSEKKTIFAFCTQRVGNTDDQGNKQDVMLRRSLDGGRNWLPIQTLATHEDFRCSVGATVADFDTGRVFLFYRRTPITDKSERWNVEHPAEWEETGFRLYIIHSDDEGETWSEPMDVTQPLKYDSGLPILMAGTHGVQLKHRQHNGRLVVPARHWIKPIFDINVYSHNCVVLSDDHGRTWRLGGLSQPGMGEACVVELTDGTVYLNSRNESLRFRGYRGWDRSRDGGETFIESGYDTTLIEPHCHAGISRYSTGAAGGKSRILFCNPAVKSDAATWFDGPGRRRLTVRLSYDECKTWSVTKLIDEGASGYSDIAAAADGRILCLYESGDEGMSHKAGRISLARFNLEWLTDGKDTAATIEQPGA